MTRDLLSLRPPDYHDRADKCRTPCVICGRPMSETGPQRMLRVVGGGSKIATPDEAVDPADDLGNHPVGTGCVRRHKLQAFVVSIRSASPP